MEESSPSPEPGSDNFSDFGNQYIQGIPEEDRAVVSKYVREWDGNVTRRFQDLQGQLKQFEEYGSPEEIAQARQVVQMINQNPVAFRQNLDDYITSNAERYGVSQEQEIDPVLEDFPEEAQQMIAAMREQLGRVEQTQQQTISQQREAEEAAMLDDALDNLHNEHGDFDDRWVVMQIAQGASPEEAVESWNELTQNIVDSRSRKPAPKLMGGGNGVPIDQVDQEALRNPSARKRLGAEYLKNALGE